MTLKELAKYWLTVKNGDSFAPDGRALSCEMINELGKDIRDLPRPCILEPRQPDALDKRIEAFNKKNEGKYQPLKAEDYTTNQYKHKESGEIISCSKYYKDCKHWV